MKLAGFCPFHRESLNEMIVSGWLGGAGCAHRSKRLSLVVSARGEITASNAVEPGVEKSPPSTTTSDTNPTLTIDPSVSIYLNER